MAEWISGNRFLTMEEMENNAQIFANIMYKNKWTKNAIAGALGDIQTESTINPGIWEDLTSYEGGYGLVQWTPYTNYSDWAGEGWENNGDKQCERILYELENGLQWIATETYPMSFQEFVRSNESPEYLAYVWMYNYERPANLDQPERQEQARYWYSHIKLFPIWLLFKFQRNMYNKK